ncbi:auxin-responsive protein SAUR36-like [Diospyros lotus]|uniref:auxin-responsive protein SAUR36-like n=1 Tax=Diospyros lotus TaxID=55363 RepID=UPI0022586326|nr:auxin-responsive protein SAUR36-like [Diospyros lotus]
MKRIRGFKLKHRVSTLFRFVIRGTCTRPSTGYHRLDPPTSNSKPISSLFSRLKTKAKALCSVDTGRGPDRVYDQFGKGVAVPKGHMAVYVGQKDGDFRRYLVPVMYCNHPLFGRLLREAEEEFGFNQQGGITIPCRVSEFESVKTRIAAGGGLRKLLTWKKARWAG